jgi:ELWxxDGT repeat protein
MKRSSSLRLNRKSTVAHYLLSAPLLVLSSSAGAASPIGSDPIWLGTMGNTLLFIAQPAASSSYGSPTLFRSDGTTAGTTQVAPIGGSVVEAVTYNTGPLFLSAGTKSYFLADATPSSGEQVWVTDGTATGTHQVTNIADTSGASPALLGLIGTNLIFADYASDNTMQLFLTDGTTSGTSTLSTFAQNQYGLVSDSIALNGKVYVALNSSLDCCQPDLWATDGTTAGTVRIDSNEGYPTFHLQPSSLEAFGSSVALLTDTENDNVQLSLVNTTSNALTILDTTVGASYGSTIAAMDGFILYLSGNSNSGLGLWRTDGTLPGTVLVTNVGQGVQFSQLGQDIVMTRVGDRALFQSESTQNGPQLWSSDGTAPGTVPLIATPTPSGSGYSQPLLGVVGTHGYYAVYNGTEFQVVVTDGTVAGTHVLTDAGPIDQNGIGDTQVAGDDTLAFIYTYHVDASGNLKHLYAYSPQSNAVTHLLDAPLIYGGQPILAYMGQLYFTGSDPVHADNPWVSDGTVIGTHILVNLSNVTPMAGNDSASSQNDAAVTIDVLANDSESGGTIDTTSVQIISKPVHGSVSVTASGSVVYTPVTGFAGSDSFTYSVKDLQGALSNVATVSVSVTAAAAPSSSKGGGGGAATLLDLLALGGLALFRGLRPNTRAPLTGSSESSMVARHLLAKCTSFTAQPNAGTQRVWEN